MPSDEKAKILVDAVEDRKAVEPTLIDLRNKTVMTDFFLVCSGTSDTHIRAIADSVQERAENERLPRPRVEGQSVGEWVLIDFGDVVVHVMSQESRDRYKLETFWTTPQPKGALPPTPDSIGAIEYGASEVAAWEADDEDDDDDDASFFELADEELEPLEDEDLDLDDADERKPRAGEKA
jgi:ribosome-associated protein